MEIDIAPGLLSMPVEVLTYIGTFLNPRLLYDMSETCLRLRTAVNSNSIWRRHTRGALVSRLLEHTPSLVEPTFSAPAEDFLDPLCDHRIHFMRQSRLLDNLRQGKNVHHVIYNSEDSFFSFKPPSSFGQGEIMYNYYAFIAGSMDSIAEGQRETVIYVYDIRAEPQLVTTFRIGDEQSWNHARAINSVKVNVVSDKLVIVCDDGFLVHEIDLPSTAFPLLYSCSWRQSSAFTKTRLFLDNFVIQVDLWEYYIEIWNIDTIEKCVIKSSKGLIKSYKFLHLLNLSSGEGVILLHFTAADMSHDVHLYDVNKRQYTFHVHLNNSLFIRAGVVGNDHVVLFLIDSDDRSLVSVYDREKSSLLVQKAGIDILKHDETHIIKDCLVIPASDAVSVFSLECLELLYELPYSDPDWRGRVTVLRGICDLVIIDDDIWHFDERRHLLQLEHSRCVSVNKSFSKIISMDGNCNLHVFSFW